MTQFLDRVVHTSPCCWALARLRSALAGRLGGLGRLEFIAASLACGKAGRGSVGGINRAAPRIYT